MSWAAYARKFAPIGLVLLLTACLQTYPLGMSEAQWKALSPQEQMQARVKQAELDRIEAARRAEEQRREEKRKEAEKARIASLYASARYGDIIECAVEGGIADFHPGWKKYQRAVVSLVRGEIKEVSLRSESGSDTQEFWAALNHEGNTVKICDSEPSRGSSDCATVAGLTSDFSRGIRQTVSLKEIFNSAEVLCAYRGANIRRYDDRRYDRRGNDRHRR